MPARSTRSTATPAQSLDTTRELRKPVSATSDSANADKLQQKAVAPRSRQQATGGKRSARSQSREVDETTAQNGNVRIHGNKDQNSELI